MSGNRRYGDLIEGNRILALPKYFDGRIEMQPRSSHKSQYIFSGAPIFELETDDNIVGLSIYFRTNHTIDSFKHSLGLIQKVGNQTNWLYDLCIYPPNQRSHVDKKNRLVVYGSHAHRLDVTTPIKDELDYNTLNWLDYLKVFAKHTNIDLRTSTVIEPGAGELML